MGCMSPNRGTTLSWDVCHPTEVLHSHELYTTRQRYYTLMSCIPPDRGSTLLYSFTTPNIQNIEALY